MAKIIFNLIDIVIVKTLASFCQFRASSFYLNRIGYKCRRIGYEKQEKRSIRYLASLFKTFFYALIQSWGECLQDFINPTSSFFNRIGYKCRRIGYEKQEERSIRHLASLFSARLYPLM